ncbi:hypothetical protein BGW38_000689 [Lunasporangiospora selenospora]|uniref:TPR repeat n=1 Tax=Lunasporangiospora selenospora TaxID=979761 RepID=A0A9P6G340_9FUNG|nr:hypothetical protein BGW38_000689 [Lunasporangiospora selenospora]
MTATSVTNIENTCILVQSPSSTPAVSCVPPHQPVYQLRDGPVPGTKKDPMLAVTAKGTALSGSSDTLQIDADASTSTDAAMAMKSSTSLCPLPQKSEDWAALVDAPRSPTLKASTSFPQFQQQQQSSLSHSYGYAYGFGYTNTQFASSSASIHREPDTAGMRSSQNQNLSQNQNQNQNASQKTPGRAQPQAQAQSRNYPYQHPFYHSSPSVAMTNAGMAAMADGSYFDIVKSSAAHPQRKSWSANDTLKSSSSFSSVEGINAMAFPWSGAGTPNGSSNNKMNNIATSVSLLTDATLLAKYREQAIKTNDPSVQLSYAKYLMEIGEPSQTASDAPSKDTSYTTRPSSSSSASTRSSIENISSPVDVAPSPPSSTETSPSSTQPSSPTTLSAPTYVPTSTTTTTTPTKEEDPHGSGKKQLVLEAIYWIERLAKEGQPEAQFMRGTWYEEGLYMSKKNPSKALRLYQSAGKGDYGPAHYKVAMHCERKKDNNKAVMLYKKAAVHNDVLANYRLAMIFLYGEIGQSKNLKAGLQYLKRAAAFATESAPKPPYVLGLILSREYYSSQDPKKLVIPDDIAFPDDGEALEWFRKSAQLGYGRAHYKLGYCYEYGALGCPVDPFLSVQHYEQAVLASDGNGEAEMALSGWFLSGAEGYFPADDARALEYGARAATKGLAKAQYAMGYYHEVGIATEKDVEKAKSYYRRAAQGGNRDADNRLEELTGGVSIATETSSVIQKNAKSKQQGRGGKGSRDQNCVIM